MKRSPVPARLRLATKTLKHPTTRHTKPCCRCGRRGLSKHTRNVHLAGSERRSPILIRWNVSSTPAILGSPRMPPSRDTTGRGPPACYCDLSPSRKHVIRYTPSNSETLLLGIWPEVSPRAKLRLITHSVPEVFEVRGWHNRRGTVQGAEHFVLCLLKGSLASRHYVRREIRVN